MKKMSIQAKIIVSFGVVTFLCAAIALAVSLSGLSAIAHLREAAEGGVEPDINMVVSAIRSSMVTAWICAVLAVLFSVALAVALIQNMSPPLGFLAGAISGIAHTGNIYLDDAAYKASKELNKRGDEIGMISRSVGDMLAMFRKKIQSLNAVAGGDLAAEIMLRSPEDSIGIALDSMVDSLNSMFSDIRGASLQVSTGAGLLAEGAELLAEGAGEQSGAIERLSETVSAIARNTTGNAGKAREAAGLAEQIRSQAEQGGLQMEDMIRAVTQINEASDAIKKVMRVIDDIAFQTNILALNASVEAARAGNQGVGFAVVAGEVRSLAVKSLSAAKETGELIEDSITKARLGAKIAGETAESFGRIIEGVQKSTGLISEIARASDEQASAIASVNSGIDQVMRVVRSNSETAAFSANASKEMNGQSVFLQEMIARFKIRDDRKQIGSA